MSGNAQGIKNEIGRLARKAVKSDVAAAKASAAAAKKAIAKLREEMASLRKQVSQLSRSVPTKAADKPGAEGRRRHRLSGKAVKSLRERLGLTQAELAMLVDASSQAIYLWERNGVPASSRARPALNELRASGKKAVRARLEAMESPT